jgi:hypothetical protein
MLEVNLRLVGVAVIPVGLFLLILGWGLLQNGLNNYNWATAPLPSYWDCIRESMGCSTFPVETAEIEIAISALVLGEGIAVLVGGVGLLMPEGHRRYHPGRDGQLNRP